MSTRSANKHSTLAEPADGTQQQQRHTNALLGSAQQPLDPTATTTTATTTTTPTTMQHTTAAARLALAAALLLVGGASAQRGDSDNVFGATLGKCDRTAYFDANPEQRDTKYPTTGYFRNNECTASSGDAGAHFVCVTMPNATTSAGDTYSTFWVETGQARSPEQAVTWPKPGPWCICMWAFARMFAQHPNFIDMLECDATNRWVIENYALENDSQGRALAAVCGKCGVAADASGSELREKCASAVERYPEVGALGEASAGRRQLQGEDAVEESCDSEDAMGGGRR